MSSSCRRTQLPIESEKKGGRKQAVIAQPELLVAVEQSIADRTAGSPVDETIRWTNKSPAEIAAELNDQGFAITDDTVRKVLIDELGLSRRQAVKDEAGTESAFRNEQFEHIAARRRFFERKGWPVISVDTKKKELLGDFFRNGQAYTDGVLRVQDHDFVDAHDRLVPYGVFDTQQNEGFFLLARGADTSELACDAVWRWWRRMGHDRWLLAPRLLLLCDCGGSNGYRQHRFKEELCRLASRLFRDIEVAHYPPGCSKYNPIEHRLFCHVTRSLRSVALRTIEFARDLIAQTKTAMGLRVIAELARRTYEKGKKASAAYFQNVQIQFHKVLPQFNYTVPRYNLL